MASINTDKFIQPVSTDINNCDKPQLFCFHPGGSSAQLFYSWGDGLGEIADVYAIELPGRGERIDEAPNTNISQLIMPLLEELLIYGKRKIIFFGYCMGAYIAFEAAKQLLLHYNIRVQHLFLASSAEPYYAEKNNMHTVLSDQELTNFLCQHYFLDPTKEVDKEYLEILLTSLKADCAITSSYRISPADPLSIPITVYGGLQDLGVTKAALEAWQRHTLGVFALRMFPGEHMFINTHKEILLKTLLQDILKVITI